jgi:hypothetical protein
LSGYTPLFGSLTTGTLCGKWPDIGLWPIVLSLADKTGVVDVTPDYLARITGLPTGDVTACMARFCEPDPYSRTPTDEGRRLALIDPEHRCWGWKILNHAQYRERARKQQWDNERTASGRDAERKRNEREQKRGESVESRDVPTRPDASRLSPLSDADADADPSSGVLEDSDSRPRRGRTRERPAYEGKAFHDQVIEAYHQALPDLPAVKVWSPKRRQALTTRIRERCQDGKPADTVEYWRKFFAGVAASDFLCGRTVPRDGRAPFRADLEWLIRPENFAKVIEGRYNGGGNSAHS